MKSKFNVQLCRIIFFSSFSKTNNKLLVRVLPHSLIMLLFSSHIVYVCMPYTYLLQQKLQSAANGTEVKVELISKIRRFFTCTRSKLIGQTCVYANLCIVMLVRWGERRRKGKKSTRKVERDTCTRCNTFLENHCFASIDSSHSQQLHTMNVALTYIGTLYWALWLECKCSFILAAAVRVFLNQDEWVHPTTPTYLYAWVIEFHVQKLC